MPVCRETDNVNMLFAGEETSDTVILVFAGLAKCFGGIPGFEFLKLLSHIPVRKIFLTDPTSMWYQKGIPGVGHTSHEVADYLKHRYTACGNTKRVIALGNSAGGFAAILFGVLIGADEVHAFAPKTRLVDEKDYRDPEGLRELHRRIGADLTSLDLKNVLLQNPLNSTKIYIHYPKRDKIDVHHALNLSEFPHVRLLAYPWSGHDLVIALKQHGALEPLLSAAITGDRLQLGQAVKKSRFLLRSKDLRAWFPPSVLRMSSFFFRLLRKHFTGIHHH